MKKILIIIICFFAVFHLQLHSQRNGFDLSKNEFHIDAVTFKGEEQGKSRLDVYSLIPYQLLTFEKSEDTYYAKYELSIDILDQDGKVVKTHLEEEKVVANDYFEARGGKGGFDYAQDRFYIQKGDYKVKVNLFDQFSNMTLTRSKSITVIDYDEYPFALSGILLVSSILEKEGKFSITPHISDNIAGLKDGFFLFFEAYNSEGLETIDYIYEIYNSDGDTISKSERIQKDLDGKVTRQYIKVDYPGNNASGNYTLQLIALKPGKGNYYSVSDIKAIAQRSLKIERTLTGIVIKDLDEAVDQLRYIATSSEMDYIEEGKTKEERENRFKDFWEKHDPSPNTDRNEAFLEYYTRINIANEEFQSYTKGWRTDMGMVFVIFGSPSSIETYQQYGGGRTYQKWYYTNKEFIFVDNTGFGDFRLYSPPTVHEKYEYDRY